MISIIIPALNEENHLPDLIRYLLRSAPKGTVEIIVSDGGSIDNTVEKSREAGAKVIDSSRQGRAIQMNAAEPYANGEILFFLHADTYPPEGFVDDIELGLQGPVKAGCYRLKFDPENTLLKGYSWFTRFDVNLFRFGDQGLFIRREIFKKIGGYNTDFLIMEDQEIVSRIKKNTAFKILDKSVRTSSRKYQVVGWVKLQLIFTLIVGMYYLGFSQKKMHELYHKLLRNSGY